MTQIRKVVEPNRRVGRRCHRRACLRQGLLCREVARFTQQVRRYFNAFGRERVPVISCEEFAADPEKSYREAAQFLQLPAVLYDLKPGCRAPHNE